MKYFWTRFRKRILALGQAVLVFGAAALVLLYFLGYYDFTFIDRYVDQYRFLYEDSQRAPTASLAETLASMIDLSDLNPEENQTEPADGSAASGVIPPDRLSGVGSGSQRSEKGENDVTVSAAKLYDTDRLENLPSAAETVSELLGKGYRTAAETADFVPGRSTLGRVTFSFQLPEKYSLRKRTEEVSVIRTGEDDTGYYVETVKKRTDRPAVELYMGSILIDKGSDLYLLNADGTPLCRFKATRYEPAYERDREGRPLFVREEDGEARYFYLSESGTNFVTSDFDPLNDGRGLRFDYPADFGVSDQDTLYPEYSETYESYAYRIKPEIPEEPEEAEESAEPENPDESAESEETPEPEAPPEPEFLTPYRFTSAYAYVDGMAAVTSVANRGGMFFLDENGEQAFPTYASYYNEYERFVSETLLPPLTDGAESLGFYYYDHGLVRVRRQIYDWWNWNDRGRLRVVEDRSLLLRKDGSLYELPQGYELEAYSEGMLLLSRNGRYGFTDYSGAWIAQPIYADAEPFIQGLAVLTTDDGRKGMIDTEGNVVLPFAYDELSSVSSGLVAGFREGEGWTVFRLMQLRVPGEAR